MWKDLRKQDSNQRPNPAREIRNGTRRVISRIIHSGKGDKRDILKHWKKKSRRIVKWGGIDKI